LVFVRVLVTGASGFVGSSAVRSLVALGHRVRVLARDPVRAARVLAGAGAAETYTGDMLDAEAVARALDGCDAVVHAAAALGVTDRRTDLVAVNVTGTRNVVGGAVARGLDPVVHVSTIGVFARCVTPGRGARRFVLGGHYLTWPELADLCDALTGVRCRRITLPGRLVTTLGTLLDVARHVREFGYPLTRDAAEFMLTLVPSDDGPALDALGLTLRPVEESVADTLRRLVAAGHLPPARAGRLVSTERSA
jgi:hypothetical protein